MIEKAKSLITDSRVNLDSINDKIQEIQKNLQKLSDNNDFSSDEYISTTKELQKYNDLKRDVEKLSDLITEYEEATELLEDEEMQDLAKQEIERLEKKIPKLTENVELAITKPLKNDDKKAIIEIRPGVGGVEASLFAETLFKMYVRYCNDKDMRVEQYTLDYDQEGGIKNATFLVDSPDAFGLLRFEGGVHRVQRVPVTESAGRIHTSTASVVILPQISQKDIDIKPEDLKIDVYRASGPGGQSVNTTDSAVRITHIPTGIVVTSQHGKSQHKNKEMALGVLSSKLNQIEEEKRMKEEKDMRNAAILGGDRSAKIRTYNFPQGRVTDHRINQSWFNIEEITSGEIDEVVKAVSKELRNQLEK